MSKQMEYQQQEAKKEKLGETSEVEGQKRIEKVEEAFTVT